MPFLFVIEVTRISLENDFKLNSTLLELKLLFPEIKVIYLLSNETDERYRSALRLGIKKENTKIISRTSYSSARHSEEKYLYHTSMDKNLLRILDVKLGSPQSKVNHWPIQ